MIEARRGAREGQVRALFEREYEPLCRLAFVLLRDGHAAEEAVMDAFLKVMTGWSRIEQMDRPDLYLRRAVVNMCTSRLRRRGVEQRARGRLLDGSLGGDKASVDPDIWAAIVALPPRQRAAIVLRYYEDRSETEIADLLQCSLGTVKSQLAKARHKLKGMLQPAGVIEG